jgi:hypothetical protein
MASSARSLSLSDEIVGLSRYAIGPFTLASCQSSFLSTEASRGSRGDCDALGVGVFTNGHGKRRALGIGLGVFPFHYSSKSWPRRPAERGKGRQTRRDALPGCMSRKGTAPAPMVLPLFLAPLAAERVALGEASMNSRRACDPKAAPTKTLLELVIKSLSRDANRGPGSCGAKSALRGGAAFHRAPSRSVQRDRAGR